MKDQIYKQRYFEAGSSDFTIAISRVRNSNGDYVYMIDSSEEVFDYLELQLPVFDDWVKAWRYYKNNYPGWWNLKPFFIHEKVHSYVLLELKQELRNVSIATLRFWSTAIRPFWRSCLKADLQELL